MKALTIQIGIFGRVNVGKSSLMNFITNQSVSIVSQIAGTTTDVVNKRMELNSLGPITLFDTAGIDDVSVLGKSRLEKTQKAFNASDIVLLMCEVGNFGNFEKEIIKNSKKNKTPCIIVIGKIDLKKPDNEFLEKLKKYSNHILLFSITMNENDRDNFLNALKKIIKKVLCYNYTDSSITLKNIIKKGDSVVLVVPIDLGAPLGKIIMPQIQTIRHILNLNAASYVMQDTEYEIALKNLKTFPVIVITDSQVVKQIALKTPLNVKLTTFSIIYAADKSDIIEMAKGAATLNNLCNSDEILIVESCTHHASADDIGRVKLCNWMKEYVGKNLKIKYVSGQDYLKDFKNYKIIIHCGGCTLNKKDMLSRVREAVEAKIPITNYGLAISVFHGVIERVLEIFPRALFAYKKALKN
ncbi:MAG: [FeFe] hydrogenase H-cluster maturation GTPase HydF [Endomicrobium sp.]|jgi:[FeFe] hydrogenase H-cluster maturation GTPase HydF|nr:[FeFe] hydrogenase H-cluster maturation GTPase HydF [Endomicrobium sp.]